MNIQENKDDWSIPKGKLTDDDLRYEEGKQEELLGRIQTRTGAPKDVVEQSFKLACDAWCA
ncbi:MAG: general stress protein CsbD [bacterium]